MSRMGSEYIRQMNDNRTVNAWYPKPHPCCSRREGRQPDGRGFMVTLAIMTLGFVCYMAGFYAGQLLLHADPPAAESIK